jgi:Flp pilus assembly protein TadG
MLRNRSRRRRGVAAVELALLLPFLAFLFVITIDWARIFYYSVTVTNCARNGAAYLCDPIAQANSPYKSVTQAALADAVNLSPAPTVSTSSGSDVNGSYVEVTVSYSFHTVTSFPGVPNPTNIVRTIRMNVAPLLPN